MKIRPSRAFASLMLLVAGAYLSIGNAAEPPVFRQTGLIRDLRTTENSPCTGKGDGGGADEYDHWDLDPHETKVRIKRGNNDKHYLDVRWRWFHELQRPHFHLVNGDESPVPADICKPTQYKVGDYLFLFAIHDLKNPHPNEKLGEKPKSPHALVYVPMHTISGGYSETGDQFYLFVFDIKETEIECDKETAGYHRDRCRALYRLFLKNKEYIANMITEAKLIEAIQYEIGTIIPTSNASPAQQAAIGPIVLELHLHNGIIHGTLGGG